MSAKIRVALLRGTDVWRAGQGRGCDSGVDGGEVIGRDREGIRKVTAALVVG